MACPWRVPAGPGPRPAVARVPARHSTVAPAGLREVAPHPGTPVWPLISAYIHPLFMGRPPLDRAARPGDTDRARRPASPARLMTVPTGPRPAEVTGIPEEVHG